MPKETKPSWWPENPYEKHPWNINNQGEPDDRHDKYQEALDACARAVQEHELKAMELLEDAYLAIKNYRGPFTKTQKNMIFNRWFKDVEALLNQEELNENNKDR